MKSILRSSSMLRLENRRWYPWLFLFLVVASFPLSFGFTSAVDGEAKLFEVLITLLAGSAGVVAFLYTQHAHETQFFRELFRDFNARYDAMNEKLARVLSEADGAGELDEVSRCALVDYFNLCAEEYLFFKAGYIDAEVWKSWRAGMRQYSVKPKINAFWKSELSGSSYYGFDLNMLGDRSSMRP